MKFPLYKDPLTIRETNRLSTKRLAREHGWGVLFIVVVALELLAGYLALGGVGVLLVAFIGILASTSQTQVDGILAAQAQKGVAHYGN